MHIIYWSYDNESEKINIEVIAYKLVIKHVQSL